MIYNDIHWIDFAGVRSESIKTLMYLIPAFLRNSINLNIRSPFRSDGKGDIMLNCPCTCPFVYSVLH